MIKKILYFAYGSNINIDRLRNRVETFNEKINNGVPYTLKDYSLTFDVNNGMSFDFFANATYLKNTSIEGILYDLTEKQFKMLDGYEMLYKRKYFKINEDTLGCMYVAKKKYISKKPRRPSFYYLNIIMDGCKETGLRHTYASLLKYRLKNY